MTGSVEQNKAKFKIETQTNVNEQSDSKQAVLAMEGGDKSRTSRATR